MHELLMWCLPFWVFTYFRWESAFKVFLFIFFSKHPCVTGHTLWGTALIYFRFSEIHCLNCLISGGSRISRRPRGGGGANSRGSYVWKILYVETKESGPLGTTLRFANTNITKTTAVVYSETHSLMYTFSNYLWFYNRQEKNLIFVLNTENIHAWQFLH